VRREEPYKALIKSLYNLQVEFQPERTLLPYQVVDHGDYDSFWATKQEAEIRLRKIEERQRSGIFEEVPIED